MTNKQTAKPDQRSLDEVARDLDSAEILHGTDEDGDPESWSVHAIAAWELLVRFKNEAIPIFRARLASDICVDVPGKGWSAVSMTAAWALAELGKGAVDALPQMVEAWWSARPEARSSGRHAILKMCAHAAPAVVANALLALAADPDRDERLSTARSLAVRDNPFGAAAYEAACTLMSDADPEIALTAIDALTDVGEPADVVERVTPFLHEGHAWVRREARWAVMKLAPKDVALPVILADLRDDPGVPTLEYARVRFPEEAEQLLPLLRALLERDTAEWRRPHLEQTISLLSRFGGNAS